MEFSIQAIKDLRHYIAKAKGDDLERAELFFKGADLDRQHGDSGKTRRQVLQEYRNERARWQAANDLLEKLLDY